MKVEWKKNWMGFLSIVLFGLFPCLVIYFNNAREANLRDVALVMMIFLLSGAVLFTIFLLVLKNTTKAITMANVSMVLLCNFEMLADLFAGSAYKYDYMLLVSVLVIGGVTISMRRWKEDFLVELNSIFCAVMATLILFNFFPAIPKIVAKLHANAKAISSVSDLELPQIETDKAANIYYMIFDEYGGLLNLEKQFGYDNSEYMEELQKKQFNISNTSFNVEGVFTPTIVPNLVNLEYVVDDMTGDGMPYMKAPRLYSMLKVMGYEINTCSHVEFLDNDLSKRAFESQAYYDDVAGFMVLERSAFIHLYRYFVPEEKNKQLSFADTMLDSMEWFMDTVEETINEKKPQFHHVYFQAPHKPYIFAEDGTRIVEDGKEEENEENYLPYLRWVNHRINEMVEEIIRKDPNAIIILQSDHGFRRGEFDDMSEAYKPQRRINQNILNCVYYKGETLEIEGLSGLNTLRKVLNVEFGFDFEMLEYQQGMIE